MQKKDKVCNKIQVSFQGNMRSENKERKVIAREKVGIIRKAIIIASLLQKETISFFIYFVFASGYPPWKKQGK